jgi:hypothetical protein
MLIPLAGSAAVEGTWARGNADVSRVRVSVEAMPRRFADVLGTTMRRAPADTCAQPAASSSCNRRPVMDSRVMDGPFRLASEEGTWTFGQLPCDVTSEFVYELVIVYADFTI